MSLKKTTSLNAFRVAEILSKSIWEYMGVYGSIWEYMGVYGSVWEYGSRCTGVHRYSYSPAPTPNPNPNNIVEYRTTSSPSLDGVIAANATYISRRGRPCPPPSTSSIASRHSSAKAEACRGVLSMDSLRLWWSSV